MQTIEKKTEWSAVCLNDHVAEFIKADKAFMDGMRRGLQECIDGKMRPWPEIKKELRLR